MADIVRSTNIPDGSCNRQDLYDLINQSQVPNVASGDLGAEALLGTILTGSEPPSGMTHGQLWYDTSWNVLRQFDATTSLNCMLGPDMFQIAARAACPIMRHHVVQIDFAETWTLEGGTPGIDTLPAVRCCTDMLSFCEAIGTAADTTASGDYVAVYVKGFMPVWVLGGDGYDMREHCVGQSGYSGGVVGKSHQDSDIRNGKEVLLGLFVENQWDNANSNTSQTAFFKWYGPRRVNKYL